MTPISPAQVAKSTYHIPRDINSYVNGLLHIIPAFRWFVLVVGRTTASSLLLEGNDGLQETTSAKQETTPAKPDVELQNLITKHL